MIATPFRIALVLVTGSLASWGLLQQGNGKDGTPVKPPAGTSKTYNADDPVVEGANLTYISISVTFVDTGVESSIIAASCINSCNGEKHLRHEDCDFSCDVRCKEHVHLVTLCMTPAPGPSASAFEIDSRIDQDMTKFKGGASKGSSGAAAMEQVEAQVAALQKSTTVNYSWPCFNDKPCSIANRSTTYRRWVAKISWDIYRMDQADGKTVRVQGPKNSMDGPAYLVPVKDKWSDSYKDICKCRFVYKETKTETGYVPPKDPPYYAGVTTGDGPTDGPVPPAVLSQIGFTVTCPDMNNVVCVANNPTEMPIDLCVNPGTCFEPDDGAAQTMVLLNMIKMHLPGMSKTPFSFSATGPRASVRLTPVEGKGYLACLNLHKKQPEAGMKYHLGTIADGRVNMLASATSGEHIRSGSTQARYWILMDHATMDQINEILLPGVSEAGYLDALYDVARYSKIDVTSPEYIKCADPKLLVGTSSTAATKWFVGQLANYDAKGLASWLNSHQGDFAKLFAPDARSYDLPHVADMVSALCACDSPEVRMAALEFLLKAVPSEKQAELVAKGGLENLGCSLLSTDPALVGKALDVAEMYKPKKAAIFVNSLDASLPKEMVARGRKIGASLSGGS